MPLTMGSLFAGIGGFDLGFERAGFKTVWQVEIDPYCRKVLERHFPHAERFNDVRECGAHNLKPVDVICGGFPCQDISNAGKRAGIEGERSGLWSEYARIISELRPRFIVVENVAALLGRGMGRVLGDLAEIGYDAEWEIISAADVGAPHLRERVWIVAYSDGDGRHAINQGEGRREGTALCSTFPFSQFGSNSRGQSIRGAGQVEGIRVAVGGREAEDVAHATSFGCAGSRESDERSSSTPQGEGQADHALSVSIGTQWAVEPNVGRVAHGVPARVDRLKSLGNAVVPQIPELIARRLIEVLATPHGG